MSEDIAHLFKEASKRNEPVKKEKKEKKEKKYIKPITVNKMLEMDIPPIKHMAKGLFEERALVLLAGSPGSGKSLFTTYVALCLSKKKKVLDKFEVTKKYKTLWIDEENGLARTNLKLKKLTNGCEELKTDDVMISVMEGFKIKPDCIKELDKFIEDNGIDLVVLDSFVRVFVGKERDEDSVKVVHNLLKPLIEKHNVTIILIHHLRKAPTDTKYSESLNDIRGSGDLAGQCDQAFLLKRYSYRGNTKTFNFIPIKEKDGLEGSGFNFNVEGDPETKKIKVTWGGYIEENKEEAKRQTQRDIIEYIQENGESFLNELNNHLKHHKNTIKNSLKQLVEDDILYIRKEGKRNMYSLIGSQGEEPTPTEGG